MDVSFAVIALANVFQPIVIRHPALSEISLQIVFSDFCIYCKRSLARPMHFWQSQQLSRCQ